MAEPNRARDIFYNGSAEPNRALNAHFAVEAIEESLKRVGAIMENANKLHEVSPPTVSKVFARLKDANDALWKAELALDKIVANNPNL